MADVATTCRAGVSQFSGRAVTRVPNVVFTHSPKINTQLDSAALEAKYSDRFDDLGYYDTPLTP